MKLNYLLMLFLSFSSTDSVVHCFLGVRIVLFYFHTISTPLR